MDFSAFDARGYPTISVEEGYGEWVRTYDNSVESFMDLRLLDKVNTVPWPAVQAVADLACGTGRIGAWLKGRGVRYVDGLDLTPQMLAQARSKTVYRLLHQGDVVATPFASDVYDAACMVLADEHLPDIRPLYSEVGRIVKGAGHFVLVGYHPFFLMSGIPTHFDRQTGESVTIQSYVHLFSDHFTAATRAGWTLQEFHENLIDDDTISRKPHWIKYRNRPVSFMMVWQKAARLQT